MVGPPLELQGSLRLHFCYTVFILLGFSGNDGCSFVHSPLFAEAALHSIGVNGSGCSIIT